MRAAAFIGLTQWKCCSSWQNTWATSNYWHLLFHRKFWSDKPGTASSPSYAPISMVFQLHVSIAFGGEVSDSHSLSAAVLVLTSIMVTRHSERRVQSFRCSFRRLPFGADTRLKFVHPPSPGGFRHFLSADGNRPAVPLTGFR
jgi:hypothetical protein